jgi:hypothetical protein
MSDMGRQDWTYDGPGIRTRRRTKADGTVAYSVRLWCLCGHAHHAECSSRPHIEVTVNAWDDDHVGPGHGPATPEQASAARRASC